MIIRTAMLTAALLAFAPAARADNRILELDYDPSAVVRLDACLGFQTMIEFARDERVENVGVGDANQWLVVPNARADLLFVRPAVAVTRSNMTVATTRRRYVFELSAAQSAACAQGQVVYSLRFRYNDALDATAPSVAEPQAPTMRNTAYSFTGAADTVPFRVYDDGRATYFRWNDGVAAPAVFAIAADGSRSIASLRDGGDGYLVADTIAPCFLLQSGAAQTLLHNDAYAPPALDEASPRARRSGWRLFFGARRTRCAG